MQATRHLALARAALASAVIAAAVTLAACGGGASNSAFVPDAPPVADPSDGQQLQSVIATPETSFRVVFEWRNGAPGGKKGTFVWTQAGGSRRWDFAPEGAAGARIGWFSIEGQFDVVGAPGQTYDCLWESSDLGNARIGCDAVRPNHPGADALTRAFTGLRLSGRFPDRTIAGRNAHCYAFPDTSDALGQLCVDASDGTPLSFAATGIGRNKAHHAFEAISVGAGPASVAVPADLAPGTPLNPRQRPLSVLALPPEFTAP